MRIVSDTSEDINSSTTINLKETRDGILQMHPPTGNGLCASVLQTIV